MSDLMDLLCDTLQSPRRTPELQRVYEETQPCYDELCQAVGIQRADEIWLAAVRVGSEEQRANFASGFRLGGQLLLEVLRPWER